MSLKQVHSQPDVFQVVVPFTNVSTSATNCYIVKSGDEALIVDTGAPTKEAEDVFRAAIEELGLDLNKTKFFLTHFHLDHAGLINQVAPEQAHIYTNKKEYLRTREQGRKERASDMRRRFSSLGASEEEAEAVYRMLSGDGGFVGDNYCFKFVSDGDKISVGDYFFEVIDTAGHTEGHLALYNPESQIIFGGDHMLFEISPSIDFFPAEQSNYSLYLANLEKLKTLPIKVFYHSHGEIRPDFDKRIDWLIDHHAQRLEEVWGIVSAGSGLTGIEIIKAVRWNVPADTWEQISVLQRCIIIVQGVVFLDHLVRTGAIVQDSSNAGSIFYRLP